MKLLLIILISLFNTNKSKSEKQCNVIQDEDGLSAKCDDTDFDVLSSVPKDIVKMTFLRTTAMIERPFASFEKLTHLTFSKKIYRLYDINSDLAVLKKTHFDCLKNLRILNVRLNGIVTIETDAFDCCRRLKSIDLSNNEIKEFEPIAKALFPLRHLRNVDLARNYIRDLYVGENVSLSESMVSHLNLSYTSVLQGYGLGYTGLRYLPNLQEVDLSGSFKEFDPSPTDPQQIRDLLNCTPNLKSLLLNDIQWQGSISREVIEILSDSRIENLSLADTSLENLDEGFFGPFPTMISLNLANCKISFIHYEAFLNLTSLLRLNLSGNFFYNLRDIELPKVIELDLSRTVVLSSFRTPELEILIEDDYSGLTIMRVTVEKLKTLSLKKSTWVYGDGSCSFAEITTLENLILSENEIFRIPENCFAKLKNLRSLYLDNNKILFGESSIGNPLNHLENLEHLDLSSNAMTKFPFEQISLLQNLKSLTVKNNFIVPWEEPQFRFLKQLKILNIGQNKLNYVTAGMLKDFWRLQMLDISDNPFDCSICEMYDFSTWMKDTSVIIRKIFSLKCSTDIPVTSMYQPSHCFPKYVLLITAPLASILTVCITVILSYKYRFHIRYYWFLMRLRVQRRFRMTRQKHDFKYDAFVCYNDNDENWLNDYLLPNLESRADEELRLKLCIHQRDFVPGNHIIRNVVESMENSWKVIVVLSNEFFDSVWCKWELRLAQFRQIDGDQDGLILILLGDIEKKNLKSDVRYLMGTRTYLKWSDNPEVRRLFWIRLRNALKKPKKENVHLI